MALNNRKAVLRQKYIAKIKGRNWDLVKIYFSPKVKFKKDYNSTINYRSIKDQSAAIRNTPPFKNIAKNAPPFKNATRNAPPFKNTAGNIPLKNITRNTPLFKNITRNTLPFKNIARNIPSKNATRNISSFKKYKLRVNTKAEYKFKDNILLNYN